MLRSLRTIKKEISEYKKVKKVHLVSGHEGESQLLHLFTLAGVLTKHAKKVIQKVIRECIPCQKYKKSSLGLAESVYSNCDRIQPESHG